MLRSGLLARPARRWTPAGCALLAALLLTPTVARAAVVDVNVATGVDDAMCGTSPAAPCKTLPYAVNNRADSGSTVRVAAGEYSVGSGGLAITKQLTLLGAQAGVDARTRTPGNAGESVITGGPTFGLLYVHAGGGGTAIDGFTVSGNSGTPNVSGAGILIGGTRDAGGGGYRIENTILTNNAYGLYFASNGSPSTIRHNVFLTNTKHSDPAAATALYSQQARNVTITENRFERDVSPITVHADGGGEDVVVTRNDIVGEAGSVALAHIAGLTVADNTITGGSGSGIALGGDGLTDADVVRNTITALAGDEAAGIRLTNWGTKQNANVRIAQNTITGITSPSGARGNGIWIRDEGAQDLVLVANNRIVDNSGAGLRNEDPDALIDARQNWWGCNSGPGFSGCDAVTSPGAGKPPVVTPWLLLSLTAIPVQVARRAGSTLLASLANRSTGGLATGPFFNSGQATFGSTPAGTHTPSMMPLDAGLHARSAFTAGAQSPTELRTTVDHQTVRITISDPPAPDVVPDVVPDDTTLVPGELLGSTVRLVNQGNRTARHTRACLRLSPQLRRRGAACRTIERLLPGHSVVYRVLARARLNACAGRLPIRLTVLPQGRRVKVRRALVRLLAGVCGNRPCPTIAGAPPARAQAAGRPTAEERRTEPRARAAC